MCKACEENYRQLEEEGKQEVATDLRTLASIFVSAACDGGKNAVEIAIALEIARGYTRPQLDDEVLAIVDDLGRRGAEMVLDRFRREGKVLAPKSHSPMTFAPPDEVPRLSARGDRPARAAGPADGRRATRATWRN
jgi:hypothetical protein